MDICGLFSPASKIDELIDRVKTGETGSIEGLNKYLVSIFSNYEKYAWTWCSSLIKLQNGENPENLEVDTLIQIITDWKTNSIKLNNMILKDAAKEFDPGSRIGFGIDGDINTRESDFRTVRGTYDNNKFVTSLQKESKETEEKADRLIALLKNWK